MTEAKKMQDTAAVQQMLGQSDAYREMLEREAAMKEEILARHASEEGRIGSQVAAMVETAYLAAAADGRFTDAECAMLSAQVAAMTDNRFSQEEIEQMTNAAREQAGEGLEARAQAIAGCLEDRDLRRCALLAASAIAWEDGGVGAKEGVALQGLARAFGFSTDELHKIMGEARG